MTYRTSENALIIFIKNPVLGKVKTRLAKTIGKKAALNVYLDLLDHTRKKTVEVAADKLLFYDQYVPEIDEWDHDIFQKYLQRTGDLGIRMQAAFDQAFSSGYQNAVIIGSDCPDLTAVLINQSFDKLQQHGVVIGPALDGGYYLIGMKKRIPELFDNKSWSTSIVLEQTVADLKNLHLSYYSLPVLSDIDDEDDLIRWRATKKS